MSIKGAVKRLEGAIAKRSGTHSLTFVIPHFRDPHQAERIKTLIDEHSLANGSNVLIVFVVDFAMPSATGKYD